MAGALDSAGQAPLVLSASACLAARADLSVLGDVASQHLCILVIDHNIRIGAKLAGTRVRVKSSPASLHIVLRWLVTHSIELLVRRQACCLPWLEGEFILFIGFKIERSGVCVTAFTQHNHLTCDDLC